MTDEKKVVGIIASDLCKGSAQNPEHTDKPWFHIRKFIKQHHRVLSDYKIKATDNTADIIERTFDELKTEPGFRPPESVDRIGPRFRGVVQLAAMVSEGTVERVLFFEDPDDVENEHPENYALLRNCNLNGTAMLINEAAHLWAAHKEGAGPTRPRSVKGRKGEAIHESVVLIAHDGEKDRMARLVLRHHVIFHWFPRLLATSGTKKYIEKFLEATLPYEERINITAAGQHKQDLHGGAGGDVIVANEVFRIFESNPGLVKDDEGPLYHVLFFIDHKLSRSPTLDTRVLLRACANPQLRVNLLFNSRMADEWLVRYIDE